MKTFIHIEDHRLLSDSMTLLLKHHFDPATIISADSAETAISLLDAHPNADLALVDLELPGMSGLHFLDACQARNLCVPIVILSASEDITQAKQALDKGAMGFISKTASSEETLAAIQDVLEGNLVLPEGWQERIEQLTGCSAESLRERVLKSYNLGARQWDVLSLMQQGCSNSVMASTLNLSENTIKTHVKTLYQAFHVNSRIECVRYAEKIGLF